MSDIVSVKLSAFSPSKLYQMPFVDQNCTKNSFNEGIPKILNSCNVNERNE